jgi:hypothetical protein
MNTTDTHLSMTNPQQEFLVPPLPGAQTIPLPALVMRLEQRMLAVESLLTQLLERVRASEGSIDELVSILNGFTNGGSSFGAYQVDAYTQAYLSLLGPLLAVRLNEELKNRPIEDLMKACAPLTRNALEELGAYRETQLGRDVLANAMGTTAADPWQGEPQGDWNTLEEAE